MIEPTPSQAVVAVFSHPDAKTGFSRHEVAYFKDGKIKHDWQTGDLAFTVRYLNQMGMPPVVLDFRREPLIFETKTNNQNESNHAKQKENESK